MNQKRGYQQILLLMCSLQVSFKTRMKRRMLQQEMAAIEEEEVQLKKSR